MWWRISMLEKISKVGVALFLLGVVSFLLSLVDLQLKAFSFLGEYKRYVEYASIIIGLILMIAAKVLGNNSNNSGNE